MEVKEIKNEKLEREILITIPSSKLQDLYGKKLEESSKFIKLQGFRPGKAPKNVVEQRYGNSIYSEVLDEQINNSSRENLKDFKLFGEPRLIDFKGERGNDVSFKLAFEIYPQIELPDFKKITIKKPVISNVEKKLIEKRKADIVSGFFDKESVEDENAKTQKDDMLMAEFDLFSDTDKGSSDENKINEKHGILYVNLGQKTHKYISPESEDKMMDRKMKEEFDLKHKVDQEFIDFYFKDDANLGAIKDLVGKEINLKIKVSKIMRKNIKELDEDLATQIFNCPLSEVDEKVEKFIKDDFEENAFALRKIELFNELEKVLNFDTPTSIYDRELAYLYEQMKSNPDSEELSGLSDNELKESAGKIALRRIRIGLMLTEYAAVKKVNVTDDDIRMGMLEKIKEFPAMANQIVQYYNTNKAAFNSLIATVLENKAAKHIIENEVISEDKEYSYDKLNEALQKETGAVFKPSKK